MNAAKHLIGACLWLAASVVHAKSLIEHTAIEWLLDCPLPPLERLDPAVLERTQCGVLSVPRNYSAPRQGNRHLYLTRVGARQPLSREGVVFVQGGGAFRRHQGGTFAIHLASSWGGNAGQAYRTLLNHYDIIEFSSRDLEEENGVEQAVLDMEFVRAQLGDVQLHYLGNAHATRLGSEYAQRFPERMARMVLVNTPTAEPRHSPVEQLRLKDADANGCISRWVGEFLVYGKQPPSSSHCLD